MTPVVHLRNAVKLYVALVGDLDVHMAVILSKGLDVIDSLYAGDQPEAAGELKAMLRAIYKRLIIPGDTEAVEYFATSQWPELHAHITKRAFK